jgi:hypothetical protein
MNPFLSSEDTSTKRRRLNDSTVLIDLTSSVEMCSNTTFASAASVQTIANAADANRAQRGTF